jgi:hypothetical protein
MAFQSNFERDNLLFTTPDTSEHAFGQTQVFEIPDVLQDGFADVSLGAPSAPGEFFRRFSTDCGRRIASTKHSQ